ncbi:hypothetical protein [Paenibacillus sp. P22]|nr:hypothetical protein [Paenibacillus sp. P22]
MRFRELDGLLLQEINPVQLPVFQDLLAGSKRHPEKLAFRIDSNG